MTIEEKFQQILSKQIPEPAVTYCFGLWQKKPFRFIVNKSRASKLGDFRYRKDHHFQTITINFDLNPYQFLLTYIHEVAHHWAFDQYGFRIKPHGPEWKMIFRELMEPLLTEKVFPRSILIPLKRHMKNPKASSGIDWFLSKEMKNFDRKTDEAITFLTDIKAGEVFDFRGKKYQKEQLRRTRVLCLEVSSGRKYLIPAHAEVKKL